METLGNQAGNTNVAKEFRTDIKNRGLVFFFKTQTIDFFPNMHAGALKEQERRLPAASRFQSAMFIHSQNICRNVGVLLHFGYIKMMAIAI